MGIFSRLGTPVAALLAGSVGFNTRHGNLEAAPKTKVRGKDAPERWRWKANATHPNCAVELRDRVSHNGTAFVYPNIRR